MSTGGGQVSDVVLSLAMIAKNEAAVIGQVLDDAASICDEMVVVDTGSDDATKAVAAEHGARVADFDWVDDFAAARNFSFDQCRGQWVLWLDADDRVPPQAQEGFRRLKAECLHRTDVVAVMIPYHVQFSDTDPNVCTFSFDRERVVRRDAGLRWFGAVHEFLGVPPGRAIRWDEAWVEHRALPEQWETKSDRNLRILERAVASGDRTSRTLFYLGNELRDHRKWEGALAAYRDYLQASDSVAWERHAALLSMAQCAAQLERHDDKLEFLFAAVRVDSSRAEAFMQLGLHHYHRREWARAVPYFAAAGALPRPVEGFVDDTAYTWGPWDYLSICHSELGRYEEALAETVKALRTSNDQGRLFANLEFYLSQLRAGGGAGC